MALDMVKVLFSRQWGAAVLGRPIIPSVRRLIPVVLRHPPSDRLASISVLAGPPASAGQMPRSFPHGPDKILAGLRVRDLARSLADPFPLSLIIPWFYGSGWVDRHPLVNLRLKAGDRHRLSGFELLCKFALSFPNLSE
jgi:hypothetical protein